MEFKYKKIAPGILRPIIQVNLMHSTKSIQYEVLVDSGADICIFDSVIGELLGLNIVTGEEYFVAGVTGVPEKYYVHDITIDIGGYKYDIEAGFMKRPTDSYGIIGQKGFFEFFTVKFIYSKQKIEIKPITE